MPRRGRRGFALIPILILLVVVCVIWSQRYRMLSAAGTVLDTTEPPVKADTAIVLAGGWTGERILKAGDLVRQGYVPYVLVSGPSSYYETSECDLAINFAVRKGYQASMFQCSPNNAGSTKEEVIALAKDLRQRGVKKAMVVSVRTHLRRARGLFKRYTPEIEVHYVGAENPQYKLEDWYGSRQGQKAVFLEWLKLITEPLGF